MDMSLVRTMKVRWDVLVRALVVEAAPTVAETGKVVQSILTPMIAKDKVVNSDKLGGIIGS